MKYTVPEKAKSEATKCEANYSCLSEGKCVKREMCKVESADGRNVLFLASKRQQSCPYNLSFGNSQICTCPVRYAIYQKYEE